MYQGWDLNPAQLPMRYAATYNFFLSSYADAVFRLKTFVERAAISTLTKDVFDDAATGQGLLKLFPESNELRRNNRRRSVGNRFNAGGNSQPFVLPHSGRPQKE
jgi:hypothetical protein